MSPLLGEPTQGGPHLIGREAELSLVLTALANLEQRLWSLVGPGGVGKTRLAQEVIKRSLDHDPRAIWFVDLSVLNQDSLMLSVIAQTLGIGLFGGQAPLEALAKALENQSCLLILDNLEHLMGATLQLKGLMGACPQLRVLVTSRAPLDLEGEHIVRVAPLELPPHEPSLPALRRCGSVRLFVQNARMANPRFVLSEENAIAVAQLCVALDGLPLALQLAGAQMKHHSPAELMRALEAGLDTISQPDASVLERHGSLSAVIRSSVDKLGAAEQTLLAQVACFWGPFDLAAAQSLTAIHNLTPALEILADRSLLERRGNSHFRCLETVRAFMLVEQETEQLERNHERHMLYISEILKVQKNRTYGPEQLDAFEVIATLLPEVRGALGWAIKSSVRSQDIQNELLHMLAALTQFWLTRGHFAEGYAWFEQVFAVAQGSSSKTYIFAFERYTAFLNMLGTEYHSQAAKAAQRYFDLVHGLNRLDLLPRAQTHLGIHALHRGESEQAVGHFENAIHCLPPNPPWDITAAIYTNLGAALTDSSRFAEASQALERALQLRQDNGDLRGAATALHNRANLLCLMGDFAKAAQMAEDALRIGLEQQYRPMTCQTVTLLARIQVQSQEPDLAIQNLVKALPDLLELKLWQAISGWLETFAETSVAFGQLAWAITALAADQKLHNQFAWIRSSRETALRQRLLGLVSGLKPSAYAEAWHLGESTSTETLLGQILEQAKVWAVCGIPHQNALSPREREVIRLVAQGFTNRAIAVQLEVSINTVKYYLVGAFNKLRVSTRAQAVLAAQMTQTELN